MGVFNWNFDEWGGADRGEEETAEGTNIQRKKEKNSSALPVVVAHAS